jgi:hypothetical protein
MLPGRGVGVGEIERETERQTDRDRQTDRRDRQRESEKRGVTDDAGKEGGGRRMDGRAE